MLINYSSIPLIHGRRLVGDNGVASPPFFSMGDSIGNVHPCFSSEKTNLPAYSMVA